MCGASPSSASAFSLRETDSSKKFDIAAELLSVIQS